MANHTSKEPLYDMDTFEDMMNDYLFDHYTDESVDGKITIDRNSIEYDESNGYWTASCKFDDDEHLYTLVGYPDGNVALYS